MRCQWTVIGQLLQSCSVIEIVDRELRPYITYFLEIKLHPRASECWKRRAGMIWIGGGLIEFRDL